MTTRLSAGLLVLAMLTAGCRDTGPPTIVRVEGDTVVASGDTGAYSCLAWDWYFEPIWFYWTADRGHVFEQSEGPTRSESYARWAAPESSGPAVLRVAVVDLDSLVTRDSLVVRVRPKTREVLNLDGLLKARQSRVWNDSFSLGHRLSGWFDVDTGLVAFYLLDTQNFRRWSEGDSFRALFQSVDVADDTILADVTASGRYRIVLADRAGRPDKRFRIRLSSTSP